MNQLNDNSTFENIYIVLIETNTTKITQLKCYMNDLIISQDYQLKFNLPPYLDYTLYMLIKSFPIIDKYIDNVIKIISIIDKYMIHPSIFQHVYSNIIFSIFIHEIKLNVELIKDSLFMESINSIYNEIEILMSIFNDIFVKIDNEYLTIEDKLYYNYISGLSNLEFIEYADKLDYTIDDLISKIKILNVFIIEIDHMTQIDMNDYLIDNHFDDKLLNIELLEEISTEFNKKINTNYSYSIRYDKYKKFNKINLLDFQEKNSVYYWIDHVAFLNKKILNKYIKC